LGGLLYGHVGHLAAVPALPVEGVHVPQHHGLGDTLVHALVQGTVGRAHGLGLAAGGGGDGLVGACEIGADFLGRALGQVLVVPGVVADLMALVGHTLHGLGVVGDLGTEQVEGGLGPVGIQGVQEVVGVVAGAVVEGQRDA